jgi:hypothetical protein
VVNGFAINIFMTDDDIETLCRCRRMGDGVAMWLTVCGLACLVHVIRTENRHPVPSVLVDEYGIVNIIFGLDHRSVSSLDNGSDLMSGVFWLAGNRSFYMHLEKLDDYFYCEEMIL